MPSSISEINFKNKTVLVRADLNVPCVDGKITDETRINRLMPTLKKLIQDQAKIVLLSHFGRPKGFSEKDSLKFLTTVLAQKSGVNVHFSSDCIGDVAVQKINLASAGEIILLENVRFHEEEEKGDLAFAKKLAELGDFYINDAFSASHRAHASISLLPQLLPHAGGINFIDEVNALTRILVSPEKPVFALVGGAKVSTKLALLNNLLDKVTHLVLGGGIANTFLSAQGFFVGKSLYEPDLVDTAKAILKCAQEKHVEILLPSDVSVAKSIDDAKNARCVSVSSICDDDMIFDLGEKAVETLIKKIGNAKTVLWNGPLGLFEVPPFDYSTTALMRHVAKQTELKKMISVAGGGDTVSALSHAGVQDDFSYVSTAGGAFLEWLEGKELPGVSALGL